MTVVTDPIDVASQGTEKGKQNVRSSSNSEHWITSGLSYFVKFIAMLLCLAMMSTVFERLVPRLDPLVQYRFQIMWLLLLAGFLLWRLKQPVWAILCLIVALPTLWTAAALYVPSSNRLGVDDGFRPTTRRILVINLLHRNKQIDKVDELIEIEDPDIVCFIEVTRRWKKHFEYLEDEYPFEGIDPNYYGNAIRVYSKFPLQQETDTEYAPILTDIPVVRTEIKFPERTISLLVSHPNSPTTTPRIGLRNLQIDELADLVNREFRPVICCGDFNTTTWSVNLKDFIYQTGLRDTRQGFGLQPSWPAYGPAFPARITIDHIFASDDVIVTSRRLGNFSGSDHLPVIMDFQIR